MREINASIPFDKALWRQDILASEAHVAMLAAQGIVSEADANAITQGLSRIAAEYEADGVPEDWDLEDIHMTTESRLTDLIGPAAGRLHTARSRNDQVATDFRLWVRGAIDQMDAGLEALQRALVTRAEEHAASIMPGFTHLQTAQPVTLGHHLMAYFEMFARDRSRLSDARARLNECPLGCAALAGTGFPIDRDMTAQALDFTQPAANSLDAVSVRDFALDAVDLVLMTLDFEEKDRKPPDAGFSTRRAAAFLGRQLLAGSHCIEAAPRPTARMCRKFKTIVEDAADADAWPRQPQPAHTTPSVSKHTQHVAPGSTSGLTCGLVSTRSTAASIVASSSCRHSRHTFLCEGNSFFWHSREQNHVTPHAHTLEAARKHVAHFFVGGNPAA